MTLNAFSASSGRGFVVIVTTIIASQLLLTFIHSATGLQEKIHEWGTRVRFRMEDSA